MRFLDRTDAGRRLAPLLADRELIRRGSPRKLLLAVPACAPKTAARLRQIADKVVCAQEPMPFDAVGQFYERFDQTSDEEVLDLVAKAAARSEVRT